LREALRFDSKGAVESGFRQETSGALCQAIRV
jgi:hypothetical protein